MFSTGLVPRVALFAPRRKGKTWFVIKELAPAAIHRKYLPVYASLWTSPDAPHAPILDAVSEALAVAKKNRVPWKRHLSHLQTLALSVGVVSTSWDTRASDPIAASSSELTHLARSLKALASRAHEGRVVLVLDEAQHLATNRRFSGLTHCLRTALDEIEAAGTGHFHTLFTGSSRTNLTRLLNDPGAPFYKSVEQLTLPDLGQQYTDFVVTQLSRIGRIQVSRSDCWQAFNALDRSPFYMELVIKNLILRRSDSIQTALAHVLDGIAHDPQIAARWRALRRIDRLVYETVCQNEPLYSEQSLARFGKRLGGKVDVAIVQNSLRRLRRLRLISASSERGKYQNEDPEVLAWLRRQPE